MIKYYILVLIITGLVVGCGSDGADLQPNTLHYDGRQTVLTQMYISNATPFGVRVDSGSLALIPETINLEERTGYGTFVVLDVRLPQGQDDRKAVFSFSDDRNLPNVFDGALVQMGNDDEMTVFEATAGLLEISVNVEDQLVNVSGMMELENGKQVRFQYEGDAIRTDMMF